jgi:hypothetical protein
MNVRRVKIDRNREEAMNDSVSIGRLLREYEIEIPGNGIDQTGIDLIQDKLEEWGFGIIPDHKPLPPSENEFWRWEWKINGKGEYVGALPKRIGKLIYQTQGRKLLVEQLSELGNIGAVHSGRHRTYYFDIVDHIDWGRTDFGQPDDCCFWSCHASAKDMILDNGGGAIRFFYNDSYCVEAGIARAWLAPWKDCWIVFNGYGLDTLSIARILAAHLDHSYYRRIELSNRGDSQGELWINGGVAYLIGPQESVLRWDSVDLDWAPGTEYRCENCDCSIDENDHCHSPLNEDYCEECYSEYVFYCEQCNEDHWVRQSQETPDGELLCSFCWETYCFKCETCGETFWKRDERIDENGDLFCEECYLTQYAHQLTGYRQQCNDCCKDYPIADISVRHDGYYCMDCVKNHPKEARASAV